LKTADRRRISGSALTARCRGSINSPNQSLGIVCLSTLEDVPDGIMIISSVELILQLEDPALSKLSGSCEIYLLESDLGAVEGVVVLSLLLANFFDGLVGVVRSL
jgi:hypothetical protein